jgi:hypothetical protein
MIEMVVKDLDKKQIATVTKKSKSAYIIDTNNELVRINIQEAIDNAAKHGICLRFDIQQQTSEGTKYQRAAHWLKPKDEDFLQALADYLERYDYYAYTVETTLS